MTKYDLSFMYTRNCNLQCSFCMYNSGPEVHDALDLSKLERWLRTVDMSRISSFGIYGGEVSVNLDGFGAVLNLLPPAEEIPRFVFTNGTWSTDVDRTVDFLAFCARHKLFIAVSGTPQHRAFQARTILEFWKRSHPDAFRLKPEQENFIPMGRLAGKFPVDCKRKCMTWEGPLRLAVTPHGEIIFQNCAGSYPTVGRIDYPFEITDHAVQKLRHRGFGDVCPYYG